MNGPGRAPAVRRAVAVLNFLAQQGASTATDIAHELDLAKSSTSDLLNTMLADGLLRKRRDVFDIGPLVTSLAAGFVGDADLIDRFVLLWPRQPLLAEHTVSVQAIVGTQNLCVDVRLGRYLLPYTPRPGSRTDLWSGGVGEPVLRSLSAPEVRRTMEAFAGFAPGTLAGDTAQAWVDKHARGHQPVPLMAKTGNLELNVALASGSSTAPPTVLSLQLPPRLEGHMPPSLWSALEEFAAAMIE